MTSLGEKPTKDQEAGTAVGITYEIPCKRNRNRGPFGVHDELKEQISTKAFFEFENMGESISSRPTVDPQKEKRTIGQRNTHGYMQHKMH